jgi:hypothetical protein
MEPDSKTGIGGSTLVSKRTGILLLGLMATNPLPN